MTARRLMVVDDDAARRDALISELRDQGFASTTALESDAVAVVVRVAGDEIPPYAHTVPVIAVVDEDDAELHLRAAIAGAVQCVPGEALVAALDAALAPDAPPLSEQLRRARIEALEGLARGGRSSTGDDSRCRVRLTRLEQRPVRTTAGPVTEGASRLSRCTPKQRELLDVIAREGGVTNAAILLGASRSTIYATLRRIAHRVQLRDSADLLRLVGIEDPARRL